MNFTAIVHSKSLPGDLLTVECDIAEICLTALMKVFSKVEKDRFKFVEPFACPHVSLSVESLVYLHFRF